ncbi:hypothetical protein HIM_10863 [Hirsutella minnesotensis 3608]|uniref:Uncharacterized protein n=1 Tax=Hirsutella minnesotensis 3608 TaxID=1043627 RepID=A0A0F7ZWX9_9HYPO|nr:hypothetical protein HIM_10863 [Hirsutella minnesotensis 3608]
MSTPTCSQAPFPRSCALNQDRLSSQPNTSIQEFSCQLENEAGRITYVPGHPAINLVPDEVRVHISNELETPLLDELHDKLWLVARKSSSNIDALHTQRVKGRNIIPTEDPRLHLVWNRGTIYIKPVPVFLLNHDFWTMYLQSPNGELFSKGPRMLSESAPSVFDRSVAMGFLRSYALLVTCHLDLAIAKESHLIPDDVDWLRWSEFICHFRGIGDENVAQRYHYGQLRLSRLNWAVRIFRPRHANTIWFYEIPHWSTSEFVARATFPLAFAFAGVSLALSSMQVIPLFQQVACGFKVETSMGYER